MLKESLMAAIPIFNSQPYFMSDEFAFIDCVMAPLLWRLPSIGIELNSIGDEFAKYAHRLFNRHAFKASLSDIEKVMIDLPK